MTTFSSFFQLAGVATLNLSVSWSETLPAGRGRMGYPKMDFLLRINHEYRSDSYSVVRLRVKHIMDTLLVCICNQSFNTARW